MLSALGGLYADTISHLRPRVMVQGNPHYLGQPGVVAEIRAILLAAVRSALGSTGKVIMEDHINHCIIDAVESGDMHAVEELNKAISYFIK